MNRRDLLAAAVAVPLVPMPAGVSGITPIPGRWYYPSMKDDGKVACVHELSGTILDWHMHKLYSVKDGIAELTWSES